MTVTVPSKYGPKTLDETIKENEDLLKDVKRAVYKETNRTRKAELREVQSEVEALLHILKQMKGPEQQQPGSGD